MSSPTTYVSRRHAAVRTTDYVFNQLIPYIGNKRKLLDQISGQSEETGSNQTVIDATVEGNNQVIAFNVKFLREVLDVIKTPNVALETTGDTNPGLVRPVGEDNFTHVIMPMHLGS